MKWREGNRVIMKAPDLPGYGSETAADDQYEWCSCSKLRRRIGSTDLCQWCECNDAVHDRMKERDREMEKL